MTTFFEVGRGICHQVHSEEGVILPGELIFSAPTATPPTLVGLVRSVRE